jgi:triphosphoribosyl-dephospho-CoA synthase
MWSAEAIARAAELACRLEASAHKPGNVTPRHAFPEMRYADFLASAAAIGPVMGEAGRRSVGETILLAVEATRRVTRANTNLGTVLLLAPLARAAAVVPGVSPAVPVAPGISPAVPVAPAVSPGTHTSLQAEAADHGAEPVPPRSEAPETRAELRRTLRRVLRELGLGDAELAYRAIRLAAPGGMGRAPAQDLSAPPSVSLLETMRLAAGRDAIAREYATDFETTFGSGLPLLEQALGEGLPPEEAAVDLFLELLRRSPDTLIERKFGRAAAEDVAARATTALASGARGSPERTEEVERFDHWLREPARRWSPGATADLVAAVLFVWLLTDGVRLLASEAGHGGTSGEAG